MAYFITKNKNLNIAREIKYMLLWITENNAWAFGAAGSAPDWQSGGQGFKSPKVHQRKKDSFLTVFSISRDEGTPVEEAAAKIAYWQDVQKDFLRQTGLKRQVDRELIAGYERIKAQTTLRIGKRIKEYNQIIETASVNGITVTEISKHFSKRAIQRNLSADNVRDACGG